MRMSALIDEFGPLNLQPHPGRQWAAVSKSTEPGRAPRPQMRATYTRTAGVRHLFAACELGEHDPPVHHLAQQPRLRRTTPPHRRPGEHSLMRH
jgi:hypothetical protein